MARSYSLSPQSSPKVDESPVDVVVDDVVEEEAYASLDDTHVLKPVEESNFVAKVDADETQRLIDEKAEQLREALDDEKAYADEFSAKVSPKTRRTIIIAAVVGALVALALGVFFLNKLGVFGVLSGGGSHGETVVEQDVDTETNVDAAESETKQEAADGDEAETEDKQDGDGAAESVEATDAGEDIDAEEGEAEGEPDGAGETEQTAADDGREWLTYEGYALTQGVADSSSTSAKIDGFFRNDTDEAHENVSIGVYLSDRDGTAIGLATALIEKIGPGEVVEWHATSEIDFSEVYRFQIADVRF